MSLKLVLHPADKSEIQFLKSHHILGNRAPSCSLLSLDHTIMLLRRFGKNQVAARMRQAVLTCRPELVPGRSFGFLCIPAGDPNKLPADGEPLRTRKRKVIEIPGNGDDTKWADSPEEGKTFRYICNPCGIRTDNKKDFGRHLATTKHRNKTKACEEIRMARKAEMATYTLSAPTFEAPGSPSSSSEADTEDAVPSDDATETDADFSPTPPTQQAPAKRHKLSGATILSSFQMPSFQYNSSYQTQPNPVTKSPILEVSDQLHTKVPTLTGPGLGHLPSFDPHNQNSFHNFLSLPPPNLQLQPNSIFLPPVQQPETLSYFEPQPNNVSPVPQSDCLDLTSGWNLEFPSADWL
eukprot:CAMPEP_0175155058 /NCGR_PEP_ID=MMETSP0087-20121206/20736_1 /TAXON_ID=136419 /ORGANISM="Unknown Unknown, Strain D1" /LENGTH=350 /DNA_ID=CAMNT_0016442115 /DNA_START=111 /DNA_END=1163 /DNA_ORIENTATION=+